MHYHSTRNPSPTVDFKTALKNGLAPNGGLYMPAMIPGLPATTLARLPDMSFHEVAFEILNPFIGDEIPEDPLRRMIAEAFNFPVPLTPLTADLQLVELFHGPTLAFKDFAARFMARAMSYFADPNDRLTILVATSGDTGGAIAHAYLGLPNIDVKILYPKGRVSPLQEKQFTTLGQNVTAYEVEGTFDDCQRLVKEAFADTELNERLTLTSANSINIGRLLPQITYHAYAYSRVQRTQPETQIAVPSGNLGNVTAGLFAKRMGLPISQFIAACNLNDPLREYLETGHYRPRPTLQTISNAMDVGSPSNFERLQALYPTLESMRDVIKSFTVSEEETRDQIRQTYDEANLILDPHTVVAVRAVQKYREATRDLRPTLVMSTAHPAKFADVVEPLIAHPLEIPEALARHRDRPKQAISLVATREALKDQLFV